MRKHRFFIDDKLIVGTDVVLNSEISHYIGRVLRLLVDDQIFLFNNTGNEYLATIKVITKSSISVVINDYTTDTNESPLQINLAQVIGKGEKMDLVIQKATELGVHTITPLYSERTVVKKIAERVEHKLEHWQKIAVAASAQSWRNVVPTVNAPQELNTWLATTKEQYKLILSTSGDRQRLNNLNLTSAVTVLIGPEGGFSAEELNAAAKYNFTAISLGPRILRTETAGIAVVAILQAMYGDC